MSEGSNVVSIDRRKRRPLSRQELCEAWSGLVRTMEANGMDRTEISLGTARRVAETLRGPA